MFTNLIRPAIRSLLPTRPTLVPRYSQPAITIISRFASTKRYTKEHEWVCFDPQTQVATIGITDYAQKSLGDVVFVEPPELEIQVTAGDQMGAVESVKAASDIYAPVSGVVTEVNQKLEERANLINTSPEDEGWIAKIHLITPQEVEKLLSEEAYAAHCAGEDH
ncbi:hypothetical protein CROQUDRAFT_670592 [Cronartium quercuum f. sp. fusiforme G11]|uniref:Glycine cleavage system H protein n=1 Tax=Cronartium quercuum f. sp. fusiforme G11 TaxID=708437 RepID=A0A9P6TCH0_9BASI|nr:hypothetical protein CROQUDRAFT_670592 [Cronartium quercuum f. sp. fusiforme G11]